LEGPVLGPFYFKWRRGWELFGDSAEDRSAFFTVLRASPRSRAIWLRVVINQATAPNLAKRFHA
jgi:hypothetical protein